jgi:hypothetical protein
VENAKGGKPVWLVSHAHILTLLHREGMNNEEKAMKGEEVEIIICDCIAISLCLSWAMLSA